MSHLRRNGLLPEDPEKPTLPADLAAVQADDALLDALYSGTAPSDADVARVLLAWRREVDAAPIPCGVDVDTALAIVRARSRRSLAAGSWTRSAACSVVPGERLPP